MESRPEIASTRRASNGRASSLSNQKAARLSDGLTSRQPLYKPQSTGVSCTSDQLTLSVTSDVPASVQIPRESRLLLSLLTDRAKLPAIRCRSLDAVNQGREKTDRFFVQVGRRDWLMMQLFPCKTNLMNIWIPTQSQSSMSDMSSKSPLYS